MGIIKNMTDKEFSSSKIMWKMSFDISWCRDFSNTFAKALSMDSVFIVLDVMNSIQFISTAVGRALYPPKTQTSPVLANPEENMVRLNLDATSDDTESKDTTNKRNNDDKPDNWNSNDNENDNDNENENVQILNARLEILDKLEQKQIPEPEFKDDDIVTRQDGNGKIEYPLEDDKDDKDDDVLDEDYDLSQPVSLFELVFRILFFLPNYLIITPVYYIFYIMLFPFIAVYFYLYPQKQLEEETVEDVAEKEIKDNNNTDEDQCPINDSYVELNSSPNKIEFSPRSNSISTIMEEGIEFDSGKQDDLIKSPSVSDPTTSITVERPTRLSKVNQRLLQLSKNTKTPTSVSNNNSSNTTGMRKPKKKKFIFPKLLFNFDINNPPNLPKKVLVLDLDETLIHSLSRHNSSMLTKNTGITIEIKVNNNKLATLYHIYKRPYVDEFLSIVRNWFHLVCFTASIKEYADPVINYLEQEVILKDKNPDLANSSTNTKIFSQRYYRNSCIFVEGKGYVKDLSVLNISNGQSSSSKLGTPNKEPSSRSSSHPRTRSNSLPKNSKGPDLSKIIIIDNSPISYSYHQDNGIMIEGWINDPDDSELMNLLPLLNSLRFVSDVKTVLSLKNGQSSFK